MAKILIVDNDTVGRELSATLLRRAGHTAIEAVGGEEALVQVREERPALVVCDILMPSVDGYEFVQRLRREPGIAHTEVVFHSDYFLTDEALALARACGVSTILEKSLEPKDFLSAVDRALDREPVAEPLPITGEFDREHLRLVSDKLAEKAEQLSDVNQKMSALVDLNLQLASEESAQGLIEKVCADSRKLIGCEFAALILKDEDGVEYRRIDGIGEATAQSLPHLDFDSGIFGEAMRTHRSLRVSSTGGSRDGTREAVLPAGYPTLKSALICPIMSSNSVYGWICLVNKFGAAEFSSDDDQVLSIYCAQAGRIFKKGMLYAQVQSYARQLESEVAERKAAAAGLKESESRFRQLAENIRDVFFLVNASGSELFYVSAAFEEISGRTRASLYAAPLSWRDMIHVDDRERVVSEIEPGDRREPLDVEFRIVRDDGEMRWLRARNFPIRGENGEIYRFAGIAEDITAEVRLRHELRERERRFADMLDNVELISLMLDRSGYVTYCNDYLLRLTGWQRDEVIGRSWFELFIPDEKDPLKNVYDALLADLPLAAHHTNEILTRDGERRLVQWNNTVLRSPAGEVIGAASIGEDITERTRAEARIKRLSRVHAMLSGINTLIVHVQDRGELYRDACRIAVDEGGFRCAWIGTLDPQSQDGVVVASAGVDTLIQSIRFSTREDVEDSDRPASRTVRFGVPVRCNDLATDLQVGPLREELLAAGHRALACFPLFSGGKVAAIFSLVSGESGVFDEEEMRLLQDLAEDLSFALDHIEKEEKLNFLAYYDEVTGVANRTLFHERLEQYIDSAGEDDEKLALVMIDLVRFKHINDTLGRHTGNLLLRQVAQRLSNSAGERKHVARVGSDHFALVLPDVQSESEVTRAYGEIYRQCFDAPFVIEGGEVQLAAKAGVTVYPGDGLDAEALLRNAESAVAQSKAKMEPLLFYDPRMAAHVSEKLVLENRLRRALENGEFELYYQPKVDLVTRCIEGVEALIRWNSPELGRVSPFKFIPLMEETGFIVEVGAWALRRAALDYQRWLDHGLDAPRIAVNVSVVQVRRQDFIATVEAALRVGAVPPGIDVEITESLIMEDIEGMIVKLEALRAMGINISLDDFGTGYSSLAYLAKLPVQVLKIDRTFVSTMLEDPANMTLVSTMIALAHALRLKVVAEGVETEAQAKMLRLLHCDQMQGFLIGEPVPFNPMCAVIRESMKTCR